ncbi:hypothetical protein GH733_012364, partial [Mirounga leonina]
MLFEINCPPAPSIGEKGEEPPKGNKTPLGEGAPPPVDQPAHRRSPFRHQLEQGETRKKKLRKKKALWAARVLENSDTGQDVFTVHPAREVKTGKSTKVGRVTASTWEGSRSGPEQEQWPSILLTLVSLEKPVNLKRVFETPESKTHEKRVVVVVMKLAL